LVVKVRTSGVVSNRPAYVAVGVDIDGRKHVLGVWLGDGGEGAKYWLSVLTEVRHRGLADVLFVCCDGLKGLPDAIEATWPQASVQTCTVHVIRASLRFCSWKDRKKIAAALRPIYTAPSVEAAGDAMDTFELEYGDRYPRDRGCVAQRVGAVHPVPGLPGGHPQDRLHHQHGRYLEAGDRCLRRRRRGLGIPGIACWTWLSSHVP
jgi:transposase-like protein